MKELIERIKEAYILETDAEVAEFLDLKPSTLSMQKNRGRLNLKRIIEKCSDLNKNWLLEGKGPVWRKEIPSDSTKIPVYTSFNFRTSNKPDLQSSEPKGNIVIDGMDIGDQLSAPTDHLIGYSISGNTMAPALQKNDIAFFDLKSRAPQDEAIFLISADHNTFCRRVKVKENNYILSSDNGGQDISKIPKGSPDYTIIGEMIWILRSTKQE